MRRPLHCLLVAFLIFSLSVDTARACWHLRHAHRVHALHGCPPAPACYGGWSMAVVVTDVAVECGSSIAPRMDRMVSGHGTCGTGSFVEEIVCGPVVECCGEPIGRVAARAVITEQPVMAAESASVVAAPTPQPAFQAPAVVAESLAPAAPVAAEPVRTPGPIEPVPAAKGEQSVVSVAEPQPVNPLPPAERAVQPASADTPVEPLIPEPVVPAPEKPTVPAKDAAPQDVPAEPVIPELRPEAPAPPVDEPAAQPAGDVTNASPAAAPEPAAPPEEPAEPNLFEEVEATPVPPAAATEVFGPVETPSAPADETTPTPEPAAENADTAAATAAEPVQNEPAADDATAPAPAADVTPPPAAQEPAANEATDEQTPATEPVADPFSSTEPARRWIDATGRYAVVGTLLTVRESTAEIHTADGRTVSVPLDRLSPHDRAYAEQAADRQLAGPATPRPTDTAGM